MFLMKFYEKKILSYWLILHFSSIALFFCQLYVYVYVWIFNWILFNFFIKDNFLRNIYSTFLLNIYECFLTEFYDTFFWSLQVILHFRSKLLFFCQIYMHAFFISNVTILYFFSDFEFLAEDVVTLQRNVPGYLRCVKS